MATNFLKFYDYGSIRFAFPASTLVSEAIDIGCSQNQRGQTRLSFIVKVTAALRTDRTISQAACNDRLRCFTFITQSTK